MFARYELEGVPSFDDDQAIGRLATEHLRQRGFRHFGFFGFPGVHYSDNRGRYFAETLAAQGLEVHVYIPHGRLPDRSAQAESRAQADSVRIRQWVRDLPTPRPNHHAVDSRWMRDASMRICRGGALG
jgi:LacI family transcriptional regulator